jgi:hypothetical protein
MRLLTFGQDGDAKERQARAVVESRRLVDQHVFSVQREGAKADAQLEKQQEAIRDCMVWRQLPLQT